VLPVEVPLIDSAVDVGIATARLAGAMNLPVAFLASSDLTHYGPAYAFVPAGLGPQGLAWAKDNDRRLLDRVVRLDVESIVGSVRNNYNACGGGAIAALLAACRELGATRSEVLRHTNSAEVLCGLGERYDGNAVGYAGVVVG
jgi:AmmeMemoRadiSam system protein B